MCPYTIVFGVVSNQKDFSHCTTHVNEIAIYQLYVGVMQFYMLLLTNCISQYFPSAIDT